MTDPRHERFAALAVGHVMGGLSQADAAEFRTHLTACRTCRAQVGELRGLAAELAVAEREERQLAATKLSVAHEEDGEPASARPRPWQRPAARIAAALLLTLAVVALLTYNYHLRSVNASLAALAEDRADVVALLTAGDRVEATFADEVGGIVVVGGGEVALSLRGIRDPLPGDVLVLWLLDADGQALGRDLIPRAALDEGALILRVDDGGADRLVLTIEAFPATPLAPSARVLVTADLAG